MFKNGISRNTGKCELGWFSLSQSHMPIDEELDCVHENKGVRVGITREARASQLFSKQILQ